jgi:hypothetical protein
MPIEPHLVIARHSDRRCHQQRARDVIDAAHDLGVGHVVEPETRALDLKSPTLQRDRCADWRNRRRHGLPTTRVARPGRRHHPQ